MRVAFPKFGNSKLPNSINFIWVILNVVENLNGTLVAFSQFVQCGIKASTSVISGSTIVEKFTFW